MSGKVLRHLLPFEKIGRYELVFGQSFFERCAGLGRIAMLPEIQKRPRVHPGGHAVIVELLEQLFGIFVTAELDKLSTVYKCRWQVTRRLKKLLKISLVLNLVCSTI